MSKVILYIAMSLDGFIADKNGGVGWLDDFPVDDGEDYGYHDFYARIGTTLMGRSTFDQVDGFDVPFPYQDKINYVFTRQSGLNHEFVTFVNEDPIAFVQALKQKSTSDIWLVGGGKLNTTFQDASMIDEYIIHMMPCLLGNGIPLFHELSSDADMELIDSKSYPNGTMMLHYRRS